MKKIVDGEEVEMSAEEVSALEADWAASSAVPAKPEPAPEPDVASLQAQLKEQTRRLDALLASIANAR